MISQKRGRPSVDLRAVGFFSSQFFHPKACSGFHLLDPHHLQTFFPSKYDADSRCGHPSGRRRQLVWLVDFVGMRNGIIVCFTRMLHRFFPAQRRREHRCVACRDRSAPCLCNRVSLSFKLFLRPKQMCVPTIICNIPKFSQPVYPGVLGFGDMRMLSKTQRHFDKFHFFRLVCLCAHDWSTTRLQLCLLREGSENTDILAAAIRVHHACAPRVLAVRARLQSQNSEGVASTHARPVKTVQSKIW